MNREEFLDELNKRGSNFFLNKKKYFTVTNDSFNADGGEKKLRIAQEECAELIQAISKYLRDPDCSENRLAVLEELADVYICVDYVAIAMKFSLKDVNRAIDVKVEMERKRVEENKNVEKG